MATHATEVVFRHVSQALSRANECSPTDAQLLTRFLEGEKIGKEYKVATMPTIYVIGTDGKILHGEFGFREQAKEDITAVIKKALKADGK